MKSNGWDDETAALQLYSHLEGDALNVALLLPEAQRATRSGLSGALSDHYTSGARGVVVSTLATHASGPGSIPIAGGQKQRLISLLLNIRGCAPRGSHTT